MVLPDGLTTIESYAFQYCYYIERFVVPDSVVKIGRYALHVFQPSDMGHKSDCEYYFYAKTPPAIADDSDVYANRFTIYVPVGCKSAYVSAGYKENSIVEAL